jgi:hypothetical protein
VRAKVTRHDWRGVSYRAGQARFLADRRRPRPVSLGDGNERTAAGSHLEGPRWRSDRLTPDPAARIGPSTRTALHSREPSPPSPPRGARREDRETPGTRSLHARSHSCSRRPPTCSRFGDISVAGRGWASLLDREMTTRPWRVVRSTTLRNGRVRTGSRGRAWPVSPALGVRGRRGRSRCYRFRAGTPT